MIEGRAPATCAGNAAGESHHSITPCKVCGVNTLVAHICTHCKSKPTCQFTQCIDINHTTCTAGEKAVVERCHTA